MCIALLPSTVSPARVTFTTVRSPNALASTTVSDFYRPSRYRRGKGDLTPGQQVRWSRLAVIWWAVALGGFAAFCVFWQHQSKVPLIEFALGVMVFAYGGLLGVFLAALVTKRGNGTTAIVALAAGFGAVAIMQGLPLLIEMNRIALGWQMTVATILSFGICVSGRRSGSPVLTGRPAPMRPL